jgi:hypothetical protein
MSAAFEDEQNFQIREIISTRGGSRVAPRLPVVWLWFIQVVLPMSLSRLTPGSARRKSIRPICLIKEGPPFLNYIEIQKYPINALSGM